MHNVEGRMKEISSETRDENVEGKRVDMMHTYITLLITVWLTICTARFEFYKITHISFRKINKNTLDGTDERFDKSTFHSAIILFEMYFHQLRNAPIQTPFGTTRRYRFCALQKTHSLHAKTKI